VRAETVAGSIAADLIELGKPRITLLVTLTAAAGFVLASPEGIDPVRFVNALIGTALVAAGSAALNQFVERDSDRRMRRTAQRPLPAGRMSPDAALAWAVLLATTGLLQLLLLVNALTALVGAVTLGAYVLLYTPLKRVSALATVVGAFPGAAPPVMGWTAASGRLELGGWILFALLFLWQLPHFLSIAWLYREDYRAAGMPLLTVNDPDGKRTGRQAVLWASALVPVTLMPSAIGMTGWIALAGALAAGAWFLAAAVRFARTQTVATARRLLLVSVFYLPAVLGALVVDHLVRWR
jgi:protoheme IX farnesyltransferase